MKTTSKPSTKPVVTKSSPKKGDPRFLENLPCFQAIIRGNLVADSEMFVSKAGVNYKTFRMAYTRFKGEVKTTMFIKVICKPDTINMIVKGSFVEVSGTYNDDIGEYKGSPTIYRNLFADTVTVLIDGNEKA